jgi:hypothetical protein
MNGPRFDKVEDRVALHELLRIGVQRGEDLTLLHGIEHQSNHAAKVKIASECRMREEIRQRREDAVLKRLTYSSSEPSPSHASIPSLNNNNIAKTSNRGGLASPSGTSSPLSSSAAIPLPPSVHMSDSERQKAWAQIQSEMQRLALPPGLPQSRPSSSLSGQRPPSSRLSPTIKRNAALGPHHSSSPYSSRPSSSAAASRPSSSLARKSSLYDVRQGGGEGKGQRSLSSSSLPPLSANTISQGEGLGLVNGGQVNGDSRFQQLLKLHEILVRNLEEHKMSGGHEGASTALGNNIKHARAIFNEFLTEIESLLSSVSSESKQKPSSQQGGLSWTFRLLQLGQLGLTSANQHRLSLIRSSLAARTIQKHFRAWLRSLKQRRSEEAAEQKRIEMRKLVIVSSAMSFQCAWRALQGRRELKKMRHFRRIDCVNDLKLKLQAIKIQRAFRRWRQRQRVKAALEKDPGCDLSSKYHSPSKDQVSSATKIQAAVRGWIVRKSPDLWWARKKVESRANRQLAAMWREHRSRLLSSLPLLNELVGTILAEAEASEAAILSAERERSEFESRWDEWVSSQLASAMNEPLPKGWLPMNDAQGVKFLNTRTRELHLFHPSVNALRTHVAQQREGAEERMKEREERVLDYVDLVKAESLTRQQEVLLKLMDV